MNVHPKGRHAESSENARLVELLRAVTDAHETALRERDATNIQLRAQALRYQTAVDRIPQGVCFFDSSARLILCNRRYAEIYRLTIDQVRPGASLREIAERRAAAGTSPMAVDDYLAHCEAVNIGSDAKTWICSLKDGRTIEIEHQPMPDGGWVSTHEDITERQLYRDVADQRISLQALINLVPDYLWVKDTHSRFVVANRALARDWGRDRTSDMIGLSDFDIHTAENARVFRAREELILRTGEPMVDEEELIVDASGTMKWILSTKVPLRNERNEIVGLVGIAHDITTRKLADALRDGQAEILEMIATNAPLEAVLDRLVRLVESQLTGIRGSILLLGEDGLHLRHGAAPSMPPTYRAMADAQAIGPSTTSSGIAVYRRETVVVADVRQDRGWDAVRDYAEEHQIRSSWSMPILSHQGQSLGALALYSASVRQPTESELRLADVTTRIAGIAIERKLADDRIQFMANHDALTGLPNRALLKDRLDQAILIAKRYDRCATVAFVDVDNFKTINDSLGHRAGDELLKIVAKRMVDCVRVSDTVARLGGDEFVVLLFDQAKDSPGVAEALTRLHLAIAAPIELDGHQLRVTSSIGVASYPEDGDAADALLANADAAMYRAKADGRNTYAFYTPDLNKRVREKLQLQEDLRNALDRREFVLFYQPQVDLRTDRVFAVEALIRWNHPTRGLLPPMTFIPIAEESGLIMPIGELALREACRQNKAWQDSGAAPITVCVNVSTRQFRDKELVNVVADALRESGLEARYLELEVTESLLMRDIDEALATMKALQTLGVGLAIDDFGTGYSSLAALKSFPVVRLKIDKSFIRDLPNDEHDRAVTTAVISLGQKLNLRVIAEGVETPDQVAFLREHQCDEMQGYQFSKPIPASDLEALLKRHAAPR
ncbi:EAL domain-containing protein [Methylovirgula sp. 4M-Z18]|uniref:EAL domain-containing protein n=1 Tax=Methylovirgula sp. 4M-Z18 TaxID=2293567 RepID=UPI000E2FC6C1|nr:EAL domain-containing protein [Methylovirgula sp. 4M-Z18]RFB80534.1 EAL domain-containing protein [Methylovirgula sp. 4M-Z18]